MLHLKFKVRANCMESDYLIRLNINKHTYKMHEDEIHF